MFKNFVGFVFDTAIENDIFEVHSASLAARTQIFVERLKADLLAWYRRDRVANPDRPQNPLQKFTVDMLGTRAAPSSLDTKAAEICHKALSFFLLGKPWSGTFRSLGAHGCGQEALCFVGRIPKHHLMLHMVFGNRDHRTSAWVKARTNIEIQLVRHPTHTDVLDHGNQIVRAREPVLLQHILAPTTGRPQHHTSSTAHTCPPPAARHQPPTDRRTNLALARPRLLNSADRHRTSCLAVRCHPSHIARRPPPSARCPLHV